MWVFVWVYVWGEGVLCSAASELLNAQMLPLGLVLLKERSEVVLLM